MNAPCWVSIRVVLLLYILYPASRSMVLPMSQTKPPLTASVVTSQGECVLGAPMTWRVGLTPNTTQGVTELELQSGDRRVWLWPFGTQHIQMITETLSLDVVAVPLVPGELTPLVEIRYVAAGREHTELIAGNGSVKVIPVEACVQADVVPTTGSARRGEDLPVAVWIRNTSPFTLTQVEVSGSGIDLAWGAPVTATIARSAMYSDTLSARVTGAYPQPQLRVAYTWTDGTGGSQTDILYVSADPMRVQESFWDKIPTNLVVIVVGVVTGAFATIVPNLLERWLVRRDKKEIGREKVLTLLDRLVRQAEYALKNAGGVDLKPLESLYDEEGVFAVIAREPLARVVREVWAASEDYNKRIDDPYGSMERVERLKNAIDKLKRELEAWRKAMT